MEWDQFCLVLETLPGKSQQTILSQLLIMTNGRTKSARFKMAKHVSRMIVQTAPEEAPAAELGEEEMEARNARLKSNLQLFAKLHREQRKLLGKKIFERIAKLYGAAAKKLKE